MKIIQKFFGCCCDLEPILMEINERTLAMATDLNKLKTDFEQYKNDVGQWQSDATTKLQAAKDEMQTLKDKAAADEQIRAADFQALDDAINDADQSVKAQPGTPPGAETPTDGTTAGA